MVHAATFSIYSGWWAPRLAGLGAHIPLVIAFVFRVGCISAFTFFFFHSLTNTLPQWRRPLATDASDTESLEMDVCNAKSAMSRWVVPASLPEDLASCVWSQESSNQNDSATNNGHVANVTDMAYPAACWAKLLQQPLYLPVPPLQVLTAAQHSISNVPFL